MANDWILIPESSLKLLLDVLFLCFTVVNLFYIPFKLAFLIDGSGFTMEGLDIFCIFLPFIVSVFHECSFTWQKYPSR